MAGCHLWVIDRLAPVEDLGTLVRPQWLLLRIEEAGSVAFLPDPLVAVVAGVAGDHQRAERLGRAEHNGRLWLGDSQVLLPEGGERDHHIPGALRCAVGQVSQNQVDAGVWDRLHHLQALAMVEADFTHRGPL
ncbi:hypothetical protein D3C79_792380 [compost metagenome]